MISHQDSCFILRPLAVIISRLFSGVCHFLQKIILQSQELQRLGWYIIAY